MGRAVFPPSYLTWHQNMVEVMNIMVTSFKRSCIQCPNPAALIWQKIWKTQQWSQDWKRSVFIPIPKKGNAKECLNFPTIILISHASEVMLKIPQARLQHYMNHELPDIQAGFRKGRGTRYQIVNIHSIIEKWREFQKNSTSASLTILKPLIVWITKNWKILQEMGIQTTWPAS